MAAYTATVSETGSADATATRQTNVARGQTATNGGPRLGEYAGGSDEYVNLVTNPGGETQTTTGWSLVGNPVPVSLANVADASQEGTRAFRFVNPANPAALSSSYPGIVLGLGVLPAGATIYCEATFTVDRAATVQMDCTDSIVQGGSAQAAATAGVPKTVRYVTSAPVSGLDKKIRLQCDTANAVVNVDKIAVVIIPTRGVIAAAPAWFDGDSAGAHWTGAASATTSVRPLNARTTASTRATSDPASSAESVLRSTAATRAASGAAAAAETLARSIAAGRPALDSAVATEAATTARLAVEHVADVSGASDGVSRHALLQPRTSDATSTADIASRHSEMTRATGNVVAAGDAAMPGMIAGRALADLTAVAETVLRASATRRGFGDALTSLDIGVSRQRSAPTATDTTMVVETLVRRSVSSRAVADHVEAPDDARILLRAPRMTLAALTTDDHLTGILRTVRRAADLVVVIDDLNHAALLRTRLNRDRTTLMVRGDEFTRSTTTAAGGELTATVSLGAD